ncbi:MAG: circadian clock KaiB family protein [Ectothiorhodospiraceae bacterium]
MSDEQLILFVTGEAPRSRRARANLAQALTAAGGASADYREIDLTREPQRMVEYGIFATPALALVGPDGLISVLYGDLSGEAALQQFLRYEAVG